MTIKTVLVPLYGNSLDALCLGAAADVARRLQAHITALYCDSNPVDPLYPTLAQEIGAYFSMSVIKSLHEHAEARRTAAERHYSEWLSGSGIPITVSSAAARVDAAYLRVASETLEAAMRNHAVVADLVIAPLSPEKDPDCMTVLETALFDTGRPVLAVLPSAAPSLFAAPVAVAWNYSSEAARALGAALPLIAGTGEVAIMMAGRHENDEAAKRVVAYLARHGIRSRALKLGQSGKPAELIAAKVRELGIGLLVMGAYSRTRAREFVFGGLTSYMLEKAPVPLLLAH